MLLSTRAKYIQIAHASLYANAAPPARYSTKSKPQNKTKPPEWGFAASTTYYV